MKINRVHESAQLSLLPSQSAYPGTMKKVKMAVMSMQGPTKSTIGEIVLAMTQP
jgi:hypothetical protein